MIILCHRCENTSFICAKIEILSIPPKKLQLFTDTTAPLSFILSQNLFSVVTKYILEYPISPLSISIHRFSRRTVFASEYVLTISR